MLEDDEYKALLDSFKTKKIDASLLGKAADECAVVSASMQRICSMAAQSIANLEEKHPNAFKLMQPAIIIHYADQSTRAMNPGKHAGAGTQIVFGNPTRCKEALLSMSREVLAEDGRRS